MQMHASLVSQRLQNHINLTAHRQERHLMIVFLAIRDVYSSHEICNLGFICEPNNPSDGLTKRRKCIAINDLLRTGMVDFKIYQWVLRKQQNLPVKSLINCCQEQEINFQPIEAYQFYCQSISNSEPHYKKNSRLNFAKSNDIIFPSALRKTYAALIKGLPTSSKPLSKNNVFGSEHYNTNYSTHILVSNALLFIQEETCNQESSMKYSNFNWTGMSRQHILFTVPQFVQYSIRSTDFSDINSTGIPIYILLTNIHGHHFLFNTNLSKSAIAMYHFSPATPAPTTLNEVLDYQHGHENEDYPAQQTLPRETVCHVSHYPGYILELSTPYFPLIGHPTREQACNHTGRLRLDSHRLVHSLIYASLMSEQCTLVNVSFATSLNTNYLTYSTILGTALILNVLIYKMEVDSITPPQIRRDLTELIHRKHQGRTLAESYTFPFLKKQQ